MDAWRRGWALAVLSAALLAPRPASAQSWAQYATGTNVTGVVERFYLSPPSCEADPCVSACTNLLVNSFSTTAAGHVAYINPLLFPASPRLTWNRVCRPMCRQILLLVLRETRQTTDLLTATTTHPAHSMCPSRRRRSLRAASARQCATPASLSRRLATSQTRLTSPLSRCASAKHLRAMPHADAALRRARRCPVQRGRHLSSLSQAYNSSGAANATFTCRSGLRVKTSIMPSFAADLMQIDVEARRACVAAPPGRGSQHL